jgi:hypothetical protein
MQDPQDHENTLASPTLAERFVGLTRLPYSLGCLYIGFVLLGEFPLFYLYTTITSGLPNILTFISQVEANDPLFAFNILTSLLRSSFFFIPWYMRQRLLRAEPTVSPLLPNGRSDYTKLFGRLSALKPALLTFILLRILIEIIFGILPAGSISAWLTSLNSDLPGFAIYDLWRNTAISVGLGSLVWTGLTIGIGIRKIGRIPLRLSSHEGNLFDGLRSLASATGSLTRGYFAVCALYAGQVLALLAIRVQIEPDWILLSSLLAIGSVIFFPPIADLRRKLLQERNDNAQSVPVITSPSAPSEQAQGESPQESQSEARLVGTIGVPDQSFNVGEEATFSVDIANIGRSAATLLRLEGLVPNGFKLSAAVKLDRDAVSYLDLKGRKLGYLKTYSTQTTIVASKTGRYELIPRILFMSGAGVYKAYQFEPKTLLVEEAKARLSPSIVAINRTLNGTKSDASSDALVRGDLDYEGVAIQARLKIASRELIVGDSFEVDLDIISIGANPVILEAIENIASEEINPVAAKGGLLVESKRLDLGRTKLPSNAMHNVRLIYNAVRTGKPILAPSITFTTTSGSAKTWRLPPTQLSIQSVTPTMEFLVKAFTYDYMQRKIDLQEAGWRSLGEIAKSMNIPQSQLYGDPRYHHTFGPALETLIAGGLVEYRTFSGRGRGGKVLKVRIYYEKEPVKRLVDAASLKR